MAKLFYKVVNSDTEIDVYDDAQKLIINDLQSQLASIQLIESLNDDLRSIIASDGLPSLGVQGGWPDLASFDTQLEDDRERILDLLDLPLYSQVQANLMVADRAFFLPDQLEDVSHEEVGSEGVLAIDAVNGGDPDPNDPDNSTWWQSNQAGLRVITFRVRSYRKRILGLRFRTNASDSRSHLQNLTIKCARSLNNLDDNVVETGINLDGSSTWFEVLFTSPKRSRYIRLEASTSLHSNPDHLRIRSVQAIVGVTNHDK